MPAKKKNLGETSTMSVRLPDDVYRVVKGHASRSCSIPTVARTVLGVWSRMDPEDREEWVAEGARETIKASSGPGRPKIAKKTQDIFLHLPSDVRRTVDMELDEESKRTPTGIVRSVLQRWAGLTLEERRRLVLEEVV